MRIGSKGQIDQRFDLGFEAHVGFLPQGFPALPYDPIEGFLQPFFLYVGKDQSGPFFRKKD